MWNTGIPEYQMEGKKDGSSDEKNFAKNGQGLEIREKVLKERRKVERVSEVWTGGRKEGCKEVWKAGRKERITRGRKFRRMGGGEYSRIIRMEKKVLERREK